MESKENFWILDSSNDFAHWFIQSTFLDDDSLCLGFKKMMNELIKLGASCELLKTDYIFSLEIIDGILSVNHSGMKSINSMIPELQVKTGIYAYTNGKINYLDFDKNNTLELLGNIRHFQSNDPLLNGVMPLKISLDVSVKNHSFRLGIHLQSDVFFPHVACPWKWKQKYDDNDEIGPGINELDYGIHGFDNYDLGLLNGRRLNELISNLKVYVDKEDYLTWDYYPTENWLGYHKMVFESGIVI